MAKDVHPPRGMRDFLPVEKLKRDFVLNTIRATYLTHGFQEIETPALEDLERLTSGQGGDNEKLAFRVMKRGEELERSLADNTDGGENLADLGLRYDLTVPLTRYYATNRSKLPNVFKAIQTGPVWRAERPQKGRYRQFVQCDIDIIGDSSYLAEIDILVSSLEALEAIHLGDAVIRVNHRVLLANLLDGL
ncbi:MAG: histidine--tRNA ligase, partial [Actinobacteria bacterium]|nr:histidine--tRNA ligase [Actinomycetota bacterium]